jgi:hypothetical protein
MLKAFRADPITKFDEAGLGRTIGYEVTTTFFVETLSDAEKLINSLPHGKVTAAATAPVVESAAPAKPAKEEKPAKTKAKPEPEPEPEEEEEEDEEEEEEDEDPQPTVKLTKAVKEASKLREVLEFFIAAGIDSKRKILRECKASAEKIPLLQRIDLDKRVPDSLNIIAPDLKD